MTTGGLRVVCSWGRSSHCGSFYASELTIGEHVRGSDGTLGEVEASVTWPEARWMYNLTVATAHTYFVGEGQWLVHNASCSVKGARVQANRQQGDLFRDQIAKEFENAGYGVKTEVVKETGFGPRRIDCRGELP